MIAECSRCRIGALYDSVDEMLEKYKWKLIDRVWVCDDCVNKIKVNVGETRMIMRIGETIEHGEQKFVIVDIKQHATMDGVMLNVVGYDPEMADKEQQKSMKMEQTSQNVIDMLRKATEGGGFNLGGFSLGGK